MKLEVDIQCPNCRTKIKTRVETMRPGQKKTCHRCVSGITFTGDDGRKAQKAVDDIERKLKRMFR